MKQLFTTLTALLILFFSGVQSASAIKMYTYITVKTNPASCAKVYASTQLETNPDISNFKDSGTEFTLKVGTATFSKDATVYIYTYDADKNFVFSAWDGSDKNSNKPVTQNVSASGIHCASVYVTSRGAQTINCTYTFTANYVAREGIVSVKYDASDFGKSGIEPVITNSNPKNKIGESITMSARAPYIGNGVTDSNGNEVVNPYFTFLYWEKEDGTVASYDNPYTISNITEDAVFTARFKYQTNFHGKGYYRIRTSSSKYNGSKEYIKAIGNIEFKSTDYSLHDHIDLNPIWSLTSHHKNSAGEAFYEFSYDDPSTIFYYDSSLSEESFNNIANYSAYSQHGDDDVFTCQGQSYPKFNLGTYHFNLCAGLYPGSVTVKSPRNGKDQFLEKISDGKGLQFTSDKKDIHTSYELEPVDAAHMDEFYFGVAPSEKSLYKDYYYTTMYTAFPYQCKDGVMAYYLKPKHATDDSPTYYTLERVPDQNENGDRVPANSAVILACLSTDPAQNRLLPLDPNTQIAPLDINMLEGVIQLNKSSNKSGDDIHYNSGWQNNSDFTKWNPDMYMFVISDIQNDDPENDDDPTPMYGPAYVRANEEEPVTDSCPVNFVKMEGETGAYSLPTNSVYVNINTLKQNSNIPEDDMLYALPINPTAIPTGISAVTEEAVDNAWYTLSGVRIDNPKPGNIYIHCHKKVMVK